MNETAKKFLLASQKFIPELYSKQIGFAYSACGSLKKKTKKELKNLCRQEKQVLFTEISSVKVAFSMIRLIMNQKI